MRIAQGRNFAFFCIPPTANGVDNLNQNILENVLSQILVFDEEENGSVQLVLVADYEASRASKSPSRNEWINSWSVFVRSEFINFYGF
jgi:hypothetical protein